MSYYKYLNKYSPAFLAKYQTQTYAHLQRTTQYADIVNMNATSSMTIDEDLTLRFRVPYSIANLLGVACLFYWYMSHANMFQANTLRNRLRSYHLYKMWSRQEVVIRKHSCESGKVFEEGLQQRYLRNYNLTRAQLDTIIARAKDGEEFEDVIASMGLAWNGNARKFVRVEQT